MPAKPVWYPNLGNMLEALKASSRPYVDRATVESLLGVGRRRAQQIMAPCVTDTVGSNGLADRERFIAHLQRISTGEAVHYETRRRQKVAAVLDSLRHDRIAQPRLLIEAPIHVAEQKFQNLPTGVTLGPGRITLEFSAPQEALEKLLALAMAISNDLDEFETATQIADGSAT